MAAGVAPGAGLEFPPARLPTLVPEPGAEPPTHDAAGLPVIASAPVMAPSAIANTRTEPTTGTAQIGTRRVRRAGGRGGGAGGDVGVDSAVVVVESASSPCSSW